MVETRIERYKRCAAYGEWLGVDLDGTLAFYGPDERANRQIGPPVPAMLARVKAWRAAGIPIKIFTARATAAAEVPKVQRWCAHHVGEILPVTNIKDWTCMGIYDDRAVGVEENTGRLIGVDEESVDAG